MEYRERNHGLGEQRALGDQPQQQILGDRAADATPCRGRTVRAAYKDTGACQRQGCQEELESRTEGDVAGAAAVKGRVAPCLVCFACSYVRDSEQGQGAGECERLDEEAREENGLACMGAFEQHQAPGAGGAGAGEGEAEAEGLDTEAGDVSPDEGAEVRCGRERRVLCSELGRDFGGCEVDAAVLCQYLLQSSYKDSLSIGDGMEQTHAMVTNTGVIVDKPN